MQGDEGSLEATVRLNNPLGHAETIEVVSAAGSQHSSTLAVTAVAQRLWGTQARGELRLGQTTRSFQRHSSFTEQVCGGANCSPVSTERALTHSTCRFLLLLFTAAWCGHDGG